MISYCCLKSVKILESPDDKRSRHITPNKKTKTERKVKPIESGIKENEIKIRKPLSGYQHFMKEKQAQIKKEEPTVLPKERIKVNINKL